MKTIAVIGAGAAGLSAAYELSKQDDIQVFLIEAEDYLGGRICTLNIDNVAVDVGGFILFPWFTHVHKLIKELGIKQELEAHKEKIITTLPETILVPIDRDCGADWVCSRKKTSKKLVILSLPKELSRVIARRDDKKQSLESIREIAALRSHDKQPSLTTP